MKFPIMALVGLGALLSTVACTHKVPVAAARPTVIPAAATPATKSTPTPAKSVAARPAATTARIENHAPAAISRRELATLNQSLARLEDALFDYDRSAIRADATTALRDDVGVIRDILARYPSQKLLIEGHCDERGSDEYNVALGDRRAKAAEEYLVTMGISDHQLSVLSFGKERPVCTDDSEACWQKNRRAHLTAAP